MPVSRRKLQYSRPMVLAYFSCCGAAWRWPSWPLSPAPAGRWWTAEAKNETGLDHCQVRLYSACAYRPVTLSMLTYAVLAVTARSLPPSRSHRNGLLPVGALIVSRE